MINDASFTEREFKKASSRLSVALVKAIRKFLDGMQRRIMKYHNLEAEAGLVVRSKYGVITLVLWASGVESHSSNWHLRRSVQYQYSFGAKWC